MIVTIKPKESAEAKKIYYKITCPKCGAEFICAPEDISSEKRINGTKWVGCPECGECIYWSANHVSTSIQTIIEEEYNALKTEYEIINEVRENIEEDN